MKNMFRATLSALLLCAVALSLGACGEKIKKEASYPTRQHGTDKILYSDQKPDTVWGEGKTLGDKLFGRDDEDKGAGAAGIGVNSFLWRASLDTVSFMPIAQADPFGGVILTDWYENPDQLGERFKVNVYILDRHLRADGVRVAVFKQSKDKTGGWHDDKVPTQMATDIENAILTRARELRVAQAGPLGE
ncbi:MAG: DUF3576 domain-containing protein [Alphaproteobacteria bacterium]|nr:DUF3576 domain-containing protein [Alphaproteobacteria bacterium]